MSRSAPVRICFVTGSRAEYGCLRPVMLAVRRDRTMRVQLVVTGAHLARAHGLTVREIEADGFEPDVRIPLGTGGASPASTVRALARAVAGFGAAFERLRPEWIVVLGDRFEMLAAAEAALILRIRVAHIGGGDTTEGAFDEAIRHSITKMAHLHFVTNEDARSRVIRLGEDPGRVFNAGNPALDVLRTLRWMTRRELETRLGMRLRTRNLLVTVHPETLGASDAATLTGEILTALGRTGPDCGLVFTGANADPQGAQIDRLIRAFVRSEPRAAFVPSLGQRAYLSLLRHVDAVVGNSSSGLCEAPSFGIPTLNVGDRQKGRLRASSVLDCPPVAARIAATLRAALRRDFSTTVNPYGDGRSGPRVHRILKQQIRRGVPLQKRFRSEPRAPRPRKPVATSR